MMSQNQPYNFFFENFNFFKNKYRIVKIKLGYNNIGAHFCILILIFKNDGPIGNVFFTFWF